MASLGPATMSTRTGIALVMATAVVVGFAGPALAGSLSVTVVQPEPGGGATVMVADNGTAVAGATVTVETVNDTAYAGTGQYETGDGGTVGLPAPERNVTVRVAATASNRTGSTTASLLAADGNQSGNETGNGTEFATFGQRVAAFVHGMLAAGEKLAHGVVAEFVLDNNPASEKIPDHAGPNGSDPPGHGNGGPPADGNESAGNESDGPGNGNGGPPGDGGPPGSGGDDGNSATARPTL